MSEKMSGSICKGCGNISKIGHNPGCSFITTQLQEHNNADNSIKDETETPQVEQIKKDITELNHQEILELLGSDNREDIIEYCFWQELSGEQIRILLSNPNAPIDATLLYISEMTPSEKKEFAKKAIKNKRYKELLQLDDLGGMDPDNLAQKLIESGNAELIISRLEDFPNIDHTKLVDKILENTHIFYTADHHPVVENFRKLKNVNPQETVAKILFPKRDTSTLDDFFNAFKLARIAGMNIKELFINDIGKEKIIDHFKRRLSSIAFNDLLHRLSKIEKNYY